MPGETSPHRQERRKYTIVFIPGDESNATKTISAGRFGIIALGAIVAAAIAVVVILILIFTPLGAWLPIGHPELEERYRGQAVRIQDQLDTLVGEMAVLRSYNTRLRRALGEKNLPDTLTNAAGPLPVQETSVEKVEAGTSERRVDGFSAPGMVGSAAVSVQEPAGIDFPILQPVGGYVTRGVSQEDGHFGLDFAGRPGTPVMAPAEGTVVFADWSYDYGFMLIVNHAKGYTTVYKHNQSIAKTVGATVKRGEVIAFLGNTGVLSSGPHLHFELWKDGVPEDPERYLLNVQ